MSDELAQINAAASARQRSGGRTKDRLRQLKRTVRLKRAIALTYPAAGAVFSGLTAGLMYYLGATIPLIAMLISAALYIGLYLWARKLLIWAMVSAAAVFVVVTGFSLYLSPQFFLTTFGFLSYFAQGAWLVVSLVCAFQHRKLKRKLEADVAAAYEKLPPG